MQLVFYLTTFSTLCMSYLLYLMFRCDRRCDGCDGKFGNFVVTKHTPKEVDAPGGSLLTSENRFSQSPEVDSRAGCLCIVHTTLLEIRGHYTTENDSMSQRCSRLQAHCKVTKRK